ncbi:DUF4424 domain-containing protein [Alsobacter metallidurans]|nr:DUF4424 domain-containing protein [Alsobacter metallidurans]
MSAACGRAALAAALLAVASTAWANDSSYELAVGGLTFTTTSDVRLNTEILSISPEKVQVNYRFVNQAPTPVELQIAFPLPDIDLSDQDAILDVPAPGSPNFVGFKTLVDGAPVPFEVYQRAFLNGKDVTARVTEAGLPLLAIGRQMENFRARLNALPAPRRKALLDAGVVLEQGADAEQKPIFAPGWTVKTSFTRKQVFPPGQVVAVDHSYATSVGFSMDTVLRKALRTKQPLEAIVKQRIDEFCVADDFLRGVDKIAGEADANVAELRERRISYVLLTGKNWAGPIRDFKLVLDKGAPDRLISLCMDKITKTSPTTFEFRAANYVPERNLKILLISRGGS